MKIEFNILFVISLLAMIAFACIFVFALPSTVRAQEDPEQGEALDEQQITIDTAELMNIIEATISKKIRPLEREIIELKNEIRSTDVLGGIGFIAGIAGVVFYFFGVRKQEDIKSRKQDDSQK